MGNFAEPSEVRSMTNIPELLNLTSEQLDELYILPAEEMIAERFNLDLNTDNEPSGWVGVFDQKPVRQREFNTDYKRSVYILVNHLGTNPHNFDQQNVGGASASFSKNFPYRIDAMMGKWSNPPEVFRA